MAGPASGASRRSDHSRELIGESRLSLDFSEGHRSAYTSVVTQAIIGLRNRSELLWIALLVIGVALWIAGVISADLAISDLGIIGSFPAVFWLGNTLLLLSYVGIVYSERQHPALLILIFALLTISLWLVPHILGASKGIEMHSWGKTGLFTAPLLESGHLEPRAIFYHNWPGIPVILVAIRSVTGVQFQSGFIAVHPFAPLAVQMMLAVVAFTLFRALWGPGERRYIWMSLLAFLAANWFFQNYPSPQASALTMFLLVVWAMIKHAVAPPTRRGTAYVGMVILLMVGIVVTHLPTSLILIGSLLAIYIGFALTRKTDSLLSISLVGIAIVMVATWNIQWSFAWASNRLPGFLEAAFDFQEFFTISLLDRTNTGAPQATIAKYRIMYSVLWSAFGLIGTAMAIRDWRDPARNGGLLVLAAVAVGVMLVTVSVGGAMFELIQRAQFLLTAPIAIFAIYLSRTRITGFFLVAALLVAPLAIIVTTYGNQRADYLSPDYKAAVEFFHRHADTGSLTVRNRNQTVFGKLVPKNYRRYSVDDVAPSPDDLGSNDIINRDYVILTEADFQHTRFTGRLIDEFDLIANEAENEGTYNHVYISPTVNIFDLR